LFLRSLLVDVFIYALTVETQVAQVSLVIEKLRIIHLRIVGVNQIHVTILFTTSIASNLA